ncbi:ribonuclease domain-containing protein [Saccharopolyspora gloriosae]|uniref:ribonuclease domain-containing protein n=1 Tax=Saccharopolyspora gloriosae TaxID=455344 RepID=UPI001FB6F01E|nr:ribonuclease domain-containing protein [Saccharopolyspora gloriosae]
MKISSKAMNVLLAGLLAVAGLFGVSAAAVAAAPATAQTQQIAAACGDTSEFTPVDLSALPAEATDTVNLIKQGGPYPYPQDDQTFSNREGILPDCAEGYYKEYTVETPGSDDRGARRFVVGAEGEFFYTEDHYESFSITNIEA